MHTINVGGMSREWMERFIVGRVDGHIVDAHLPTWPAVTSYTGRETPAQELDNRWRDRSIAVDTLTNLSINSRG